MVVSPGFTVVEIREFVHEYGLVPFGRKGAWLAERGVSYDRLRRWRGAVLYGDLCRGLVPRQGYSMTVSPGEHTAYETERAVERAAHAAEIARLNARIVELEQTRDTLGKAIGLLHAMNDQGPGAEPRMTDPSDS